MKNINRYFQVIDRSLFYTTGTLDYDRLTDAIIKLANAVNDYDGDSTEMWLIGEFRTCCLDELIIGAYWHYTEWHAGQYSDSYMALCAIGRVFDPGMTWPETLNEAYLALNNMAEENQ